MDLLKLEYQTPESGDTTKIPKKFVKETPVSISLTPGLALSADSVGTSYKVLADSVSVLTESGVLQVQLEDSTTSNFQVGHTVKVLELTPAAPICRPWVVMVTKGALIACPFDYETISTTVLGNTGKVVQLQPRESGVIISHVQVQVATASGPVRFTVQSASVNLGTWSGVLAPSQKVVSIDVDWMALTSSVSITATGVVTMSSVSIFRPLLSQPTDFDSTQMIPCTISTTYERGVFFQGVVPVQSVNGAVVLETGVGIDMNTITSTGDVTSYWKDVLAANADMVFTITLPDYFPTMGTWVGPPSTWSFTVTPTGVCGFSLDDFTGGEMVVVGMDPTNSILYLQGPHLPQPWLGPGTSGSGGSKALIQQVDRNDFARSTSDTTSIYSYVFDEPLVSIKSYKVLSVDIPFTLYNTLPSGRISWEGYGSGSSPTSGSLTVPISTFTFTTPALLLQTFMDALNQYSPDLFLFEYSGPPFNNAINPQGPQGSFQVQCRVSDTLLKTAFNVDASNGVTTITYPSHGMLAGDSVILDSTKQKCVVLSVSPGSVRLSGVVSLPSTSTVKVWRPYYLKMQGSVLDTLGFSSISSSNSTSSTSNSSSSYNNNNSYVDILQSSGEIKIYPAPYLELWATLSPGADPAVGSDWDRVAKIPLKGREGSYMHDHVPLPLTPYYPPLKKIDGITFYMSFPSGQVVYLGNQPVGVVFVFTQDPEVLFAS